ncbi:hypothetical protein Tco_0586339 [Tanacetum coccineum]
MVQREPYFILEVVDNGFGSLAMRARVFLSDGIEWWWNFYGGDGGRRDKAILHMLCVLDGLLDVLVKGVKLVKFLLYWSLVMVEKVKALGANGDMSGSRVGVVWMEVGGGIVRAKVVSRVVLRGFWVDELTLKAMEFGD